MAVEGISGVLSAVQRQAEAVDQAAAKIARAGLPTADPSPDAVRSEQESAGAEQLIVGMTESFMARSAFVASLKLAEIANQNIATALTIGGYDHEQG